MGVARGVEKGRHEANLLDARWGGDYCGHGDKFRDEKTTAVTGVT